MQDDAERLQVEAQVDAAHTALSAEHSAAIERWPLPSFQAEVLDAHVEDEWAYIHAFAEPSP